MKNIRLEKLTNKLPELGLNGFLISDPSDIYYLSKFKGLSPKEREAWILVMKEDSYLFTNPLYFPATSKLENGFKTIKTTAEKPVINHISEILRSSDIIGFDPASISYKEHQKFLSKINEDNFRSIESPVKYLRLYKDENEINDIKKAVKITDSAWNFIQSTSKIGQTELDVSYIIEDFIRTHGADDVAWRPIIVASGANSANPHHVTSNKVIKKGDIILIDMGAKVNEYVSDLTRIIFTSPPNEEQIHVYNTVLDANNYASSIIQSGSSRKSIDYQVRKILKKNGFTETKGQYPHNLGHGIGIDIHESPSIGKYTIGTLEDNMVFTIEPAIYLENKFGIRLEDSVMLKNGKLDVLSKSTKEIVVIS